jgi:4-diphosphocytidyl-2-C-methyl-D-erythritol kinase
MGGGSSDAATTLLALNRLWGLQWPRARLAEVGLALGADVPFFVGGQNAFVQGIGEQLTPLALPQGRYAVVKPQAAIATADIFGHPALVRDTEPVIVAGSFDGAGRIGCPANWDAGFGRNDLQAPAQDRCPEVAQAARWLEARYGNSRMTGSGSAVFARAGTGEPPVAALPADELPPGWVGRMCRSLAEHPLVGWAG